jgi:hypothetical protein
MRDFAPGAKKAPVVNAGTGAKGEGGTKAPMENVDTTAPSAKK